MYRAGQRSAPRAGWLWRGVSAGLATLSVALGTALVMRPTLAPGEHIVYVQRNYQPANANIPEVQEWMTTEGQYFPGFDPNSYAEGAWLGAKTFTDVARKLGGNLTRNALLTALNALHGYHNGFTPDVSMSSDHGPNKQVLWLKWDAGSKAYNPITGFQPW